MIELLELHPKDAYLTQGGRLPSKSAIAQQFLMVIPIEQRYHNQLAIFNVTEDKISSVIAVYFTLEYTYLNCLSEIKWRV